MFIPLRSVYMIDVPIYEAPFIEHPRALGVRLFTGGFANVPEAYEFGVRRVKPVLVQAEIPACFEDQRLVIVWKVDVLWIKETEDVVGILGIQNQGMAGSFIGGLRKTRSCD